MSSIQANAIKTYMRLKLFLSPQRGTYNVAEARTNTEALASMFKALVPGQCEPVMAKGIQGEWLVPAEAISGRVVLYLHGGNYNAGSAHLHRILAMNTGYAASLIRCFPSPNTHLFPLPDNLHQCSRFFIRNRKDVSTWPLISCLENILMTQ